MDKIINYLNDKFPDKNFPNLTKKFNKILNLIDDIASIEPLISKKILRIKINILDNKVIETNRKIIPMYNLDSLFLENYLRLNKIYMDLINSAKIFLHHKLDNEVYYYPIYRKRYDLLQKFLKLNNNIIKTILKYKNYNSDKIWELNIYMRQYLKPDIIKFKSDIEKLKINQLSIFDNNNNDNEDNEDNEDTYYKIKFFKDINKLLNYNTEKLNKLYYL